MKLRRTAGLMLAATLIFLHPVYAAEDFPFKAKVSGNGINIRSDSTVSAAAICTVSRDDFLEVIGGSYDWYRVRLPRSAPAFVKKDLTVALDEKTARIARSNVNIRLSPNESAPILGRANESEAVRIVEDAGDWYRIEPTNSTSGWIHKKFAVRLKKEDLRTTEKPPQEPQKIREIISTAAGSVITVEGLLRPKTIKTIASHKLICADKKIFLIKGDSVKLDEFNARKVKVSGTVTDTDSQAPVIEVTTVEALD